MRFDLTDLRLFVNVAEAGSITAGAERTNLSLASASARICGMEETLGAALLRREQRGDSPTPAGRALLHHALLVLGQMEHMRSDLRGYARGLRGRIRLLSNAAAASEALPGPLASFLAAHPDVDIGLETRPSHAIVEALAAGTADVGIAADTTDLGGLETYAFARDRLVLAVPPGHPLADVKTISFREVLDEPFVGLGGDSVLQAHVARHAAIAGKSLHLRIGLAGFEAVCRMVSGGVGLAVMPRSAAERSARTMPIRIVALTDSWTSRRLLICVRRLDALPGHARDLVAHLRAAGEAVSA